MIEDKNMEALLTPYAKIAEIYLALAGMQIRLEPEFDAAWAENVESLYEA